MTIVLDTNNKTIECILNTKTKQRKKQHTHNIQQTINYIYIYRDFPNSVGFSSVYGIKWSIGDILTTVLDTNNKTIEYILNNKSLGIAFTDVDVTKRWYPAASLSIGQQCRFNFGDKPLMLLGKFKSMEFKKKIQIRQRSNYKKKQIPIESFYCEKKKLRRGI